MLSSNTLSPTTADYGGGMYLYQSIVTLTGNTINSNIANDGTAAYLYQGDAGLTNNLVADNRSRGVGAGLHSKGSSSRLLQNTIARNGSGVYVTNSSNYSSVVLTNTILVSHSVGITVTRGNTATLEATLWGLDDWVNVTDWGGAGTIITGTRKAWGNPSFLDPEAGDYHIGPGSAAIDAGVDAGVTTDIDDDPRPVGDGFDIGADEYFPRVGVVYLPVTLRSHSP